MGIIADADLVVGLDDGSIRNGHDCGAVVANVEITQGAVGVVRLGPELRALPRNSQNALRIRVHAGANRRSGHHSAAGDGEVAVSIHRINVPAAVLAAYIDPFRSIHDRACTSDCHGDKIAAARTGINAARIKIGTIRHRDRTTGRAQPGSLGQIIGIADLHTGVLTRDQDLRPRAGIDTGAADKGGSPPGDGQGARGTGRPGDIDAARVGPCGSGPSDRQGSIATGACFPGAG